MSRTPLTEREGYVLERLYEGQRWSVQRIAVTLGLGRRLIENALRRRNIALVHRRRRDATAAVAIDDDAARAWFANEREFNDGEAPVKLTKEGPAFRRRRCWRCGYLLAYRVRCRCGARLNAPPDHDEVTNLRREEEERCSS